MGLFDKKSCSICGAKIGLLGAKKLKDGNLCGDCAKKLSVWFQDRSDSTVSEIQFQIDTRQSYADLLTKTFKAVLVGEPS